MSVPKMPYFYTPDEYFDFGLAGEHPVIFTAWIDDREPGCEASVHIVSVCVHPTISDPKSQTWDITEEIKKYPERLRRYEDEIREHFEKAKDEDWEREGA